MKTEEAYKLFIEYGQVERGYAQETLGNCLTVFRRGCVPRFRIMSVMHCRSTMVDRGVSNGGRGKAYP